jgi:hypothetical protein
LEIVVTASLSINNFSLDEEKTAMKASLNTDPAAPQAEEDPPLVPTQEDPSNMDNAAADDRNKKGLLSFIIFAGLVVGACLAYTITAVVWTIKEDWYTDGYQIGILCFLFSCFIWTGISAAMLILRVSKARRGDDSIMKPCCCPSAFLKWTIPVLSTLLAVFFVIFFIGAGLTYGSSDIWRFLWLPWVALAVVGFIFSCCNPGMKALGEEGLRM